MRSVAMHMHVDYSKMKRQITQALSICSEIDQQVHLVLCECDTKLPGVRAVNQVALACF